MTEEREMILIIFKILEELHSETSWAAMWDRAYDIKEKWESEEPEPALKAVEGELKTDHA